MNTTISRRLVAACFLTMAMAATAYAQQTASDPFVGVEQLSKGATTIKNVDLDNNAMRSAAGADPQAAAAMNNMDDVSVHEYGFPKPGMYSMDAVKPYAQKLTTDGWKQMVYKQDSEGISVVATRDANSGEEKEMAVLKAGPTELKFVYIRYRGKLANMDMYGMPKLEHRPN